MISEIAIGLDSASSFVRLRQGRLLRWHLLSEIHSHATIIAEKPAEYGLEVRPKVSIDIRFARN